MNPESEFLPIAKAHFKEEDLSRFDFEILAGDASSRIYIRIAYENKTYLLCLNDSTNPKHNQEFIYWTKEYAESDIKVPKVYFYKPGVILQEDFGDLSLLNKYSFKEDDIKNLYLKSIDELIKIHEIKRDKDKIYDRFDDKKLNFEIDMTLEYFVKGMNKEDDSEVRNIRNLFQPVLKFIQSNDYVISHRDYHSKNIMVQDEDICVIDYQDSMLGARQYDLCSLVDDCYTDLSESFKKKLINYYFETSRIGGSKEEFSINYYYSMIQRTFKAIGSFAYQSLANNNDNYLPYINSSMENLKIVLSNIPELGKLKNSLYGYKYEG